MPTLVTDPDIIAQLNAPDRPPVQSTPRVIGDAEAEASGLYEKRGNGPKLVTDPAILEQLNAQPSRAPVRITVNPVSDRFVQPPQPQNANALTQGLNQRSADLTRGPELSPAAQMLIDANNQVGAASQGTNPNVSNYNGKLISNETFEDDAGNVLYRDPQTGKVNPTNNATQIAIRDPHDGIVKVFERSADTDESPVVGVSRVLSPGLMAGAPTARAAIAAAPAAVVKASDTFATAKPFYRAFTKEAGGISVPPETAQGIGERLRRALDRVNLDPEMAGAPAKAAIGRLENPSEPMTLDYLQRVKRVASRGFNSSEKDVRDGAAALSGEISKVISEVSPQASKNLKTADQIHATAIAQQELQRKAAVAGLRTGRAGYGGNSVNSMRQVLSPIVQRSIEGKSVPFKPDEIAAMRDIVEGTSGTNAARFVGQLSPKKGIIQTGSEIGAAVGATAVGGPLAGLAVGAGLPALGIAGNKIAAVMTGKQIERLNQLVAKRSPAYKQAVAKAVERWDRAQIEVGNNPTPNRFAAFLSASRALAAGLQRDGIQISSGQLLKQLAGQPPASADEPQPPVRGGGGQ